MSKSLFEVGTKAQFDALEVKDDSVMYWITDTQELYKGNVRYAIGKEATDEEAGLMSAEDKSFIESLKDLVDSGVISANISVANGAEIGTYGISIYNDEVDDNASTPAVMSLRSAPAVMSLSAETWTADKEHYPWYDCYYDEAYSYIDENKNIKIDNGQINITNESYAQFIPFEMKRYYDGIDLSQMTISMIYITQDGYNGEAEIVNMQYGTDSVRFAWLIDEKVTHVSGNIRFEVQARGTVFDSNGNSKPYVWKSRIGSGISVIQSLVFDGNVELDQNWMNDLVASVVQRVAESITDEKISSAATNAVRKELSNYYTKTEINTNLNKYALKTEIPVVPTRISSFTNDAGYITSIPDEYVTETELNSKGYLTQQQALSEYAKKTELNGLATQEYVDNAIDGVDVSGQLINYAKKEDVYTKQEVDDAISSVDVSSQLVDYAKKENVYTKEEVDNAISNVDVSSQLQNYATKTEVESSINTLTSSIETNTTNISSLSNTVTDLQTTVNGIDTSPRKTYDVAYNDTEDPDVGENVFVLYEIENEGADNEKKEPKKKFTIVGGSGGSSTSSILKIKYITTSPIVATVNDKVIIKYDFSGTDSSGEPITDGTATWKVGGRIIATNTIVAGENSFDITEFLSIGTQKAQLSITDSNGSLVTKTWTIQKIDVKIESSFNDRLTYPIGQISFDYTPYGAISKEVHFILDGVEIGVVSTSASGVPMSYTIPEQTHGAHLLEAYITATINSNTIESNHIYKDIIWYDSQSNVPVIGCISQNFTALQYDSTNIIYTVYDPLTDSPVVTLAVDGKDVSTLTLSQNTNTWQYKSSDIGSHVLTITCRETVKTLNVTIEELDINVEPVTAGLVFDFNPSGRSNNDANRLWSYNDITMTVSDNFDWINGGYQIDENGDQYFCVKSGTTATINYNLFSNDAKKTGKEFKVVFKTTNIKNRDTTFISCIDNNIGLDMKVESANIYSSNGSLYSPYCEEDVIEFEFNINKDTDIPMVLTYEDGVGNRPMIYTSDASFMQVNANPITIGSEDCDVYIYRMKAYSTSLTDRGILSNFIADARNADEMISRYNRNQIYDENGLLTPETFAEKCPDLRVIMVDAPWFTNDKKNKVDDTNITMIYKNGDPILDNWTCTGAQHSGQGTSSNEYGYAGRNIDLIMNKDTSLFTLGDGVKTSKTITLTRDSVPTNYLNVKVNIASSENENNAQLAKRYNDYNPFKRTAKIKDSKVKDTMEFYNCVIFIRERNEDISTHREFQDTKWHYYALGNVGDSKKTDKTRVNDKNDPKEFVIEILDYNVPLAEFPTGYTGENGKKAICPVSEWKAGNIAYDYLYAPYKYKDGEFKSFGTESYEFRYEMKGITEEQREVNINSWREFYKFVVTSTNDEFYANFNKYFVADSALYYYLFTERYTMVDNRAKNSFWHYGKAYYTTEEATAFQTEFGSEIPSKYIDDEQASFNNGYRYDLTFGYDMDTALGIGNTGKLEIAYGKEDTDFYVDGDPSSSYIYRAAESTFFCRVRDLFKSELQVMFVDRENANAWSSDSLINQWDKAQSQFPEEVWRLDIQRKYLRTYQGISIDNSIAGTANQRFLTEMLNGRKKYQRRMFERNQELYMATKYFGNTATQDQIMMRFNNPIGAVVSQDYTLYLTPYSDMYIGVKFGNVSPVNFRAKAGVEYTVPYSISTDTADITLIYGASFIQAIGDLSRCYVGDNDFSKASRLQRLVIGSAVEGYENTYMTKITLGNNKLLEYLDIRKVTGLNSVIDLSQCNNLMELHAEGSTATGVIFSNGGKLKKAYIPPIVSLTAKNLNNIEIFEVESYDRLQTLVVENTPFINTYEVINSANNLNTVRLIGVNWDSSYNIENTSILDRLLTLRGIDNDGYETSISIIVGRLHSAIVKQKQLEIYNSTWNDLEISYNTLITQYIVTFVNKDGTVLDIQYVDKGTKPVDPITREENPIETPTLASTVSTDYTFDGWDTEFINIFENTTIRATYTETIRQYTIKYMSNGNILQEIKANYGTIVSYTGDIPTYTAEESAYKYYLFDGWNKSGYVDGDKNINAVYDSCEYNSGYFDGKDISTMRPVEIYAMIQLGLESQYVESQDSISIALGNDISFEDIEEKELISDATVFTGTNCIDTGEQLFSEDKDFVLAIDYYMDSSSTNNNVLAQCYSDNGMSGFKLWYNNGVKLGWGSSSTAPSTVGNREMLVLRHIKGENGLHVYVSNTQGSSTSYVELSGMHSVIHDNTLVFGCARADDGAYENYAKGTIYWSKIWYADLGDEVCSNIAYWPHEAINFEMCGFKRYYLSNNASKRSSMTFLASVPLSRKMALSSSTATTGGWANFTLNTYLNSRIYSAFPIKWKQLIKQVKIKSSIGDKSTEISSSDCYIAIPAAIQIDSRKTNEPYINEDSAIDYFTTDGSRILYDKDGNAVEYWTRSPDAGYINYMLRVRTNGTLYSFDYPNSEKAIRILFSI